MLDDLLLDKLCSRFLLKNILIPVIANKISTKQTTTKISNKINVNAKTKDLDENPLFTECDDNLHKTDTFHQKVKEANDHDTSKGSIGHRVGFHIEDRDVDNQILAHYPDIRKDHRFTNSCMFAIIFRSMF